MVTKLVTESRVEVGEELVGRVGGLLDQAVGQPLARRRERHDRAPTVIGRLLSLHSPRHNESTNGMGARWLRQHGVGCEFADAAHSAVAEYGQNAPVGNSDTIGGDGAVKLV